MPLTEDPWRFVVETLLGVRPERCEALVGLIAARHPAHERRAALARSFLPRATIAGAPSGFCGELPKMLGLALLEERAILRQRATLLAALERLEDPHFFERAGWPKRALGITPDRSGAAFVLREGVRFALRLAVLRASHAATRWLGGNVASVAGAAAGAAFDAIEQAAFNAYALEKTKPTAPRTRQSDGRSARVIPLRRADHRTRAKTEESS